MRSSSIVVTILALGLWTLAPSSAQACGETEQEDITNKWLMLDIHSSLIASEGVVLFNARRGYELNFNRDDAEALAALSADATLDGQPISGSFELQEGWDGLVWRPDAPLTPGANLQISVFVDNDAIIDEDTGDWESEIPNLERGPYEVGVSQAPAPGLELLAASVGHGPVQLLIHGNSVEDLDRLVCCDGAYPIQYDSSCGGDEVGWNAGHCSWKQGVGYTIATWTLELDGVPQELVGNVSWRVELDGEFYPLQPWRTDWSRSIDEPTCARLEAQQRATGEVALIDELCVGEDIADSLGLQDRDVSQELASMCEGEAYVCEVVDDRWDAEQCEAWSPEPPNEGDGDGDEGGDGDGDGDGESEGERESEGGESEGSEGGESESGGGEGDNAIDGEGGGCSLAGDAGSSLPLTLALLGLLGLRRRSDG